MLQLYEQLAACPEAEREGTAAVEARRAREGAAEAEEKIALTAAKGDDWETEELSWLLSRWASKLLLLLSAPRADDAATRRRCLESMPSRKKNANEKARELETEFLKRRTEE